jgi:hypothetical protein
LPSKATETNVNKATSGLTRLPGRDLSLFLLVGAARAVGWRLPADGRQPAAFLVLELAGWEGRMLGG